MICVTVVGFFQEYTGKKHFSLFFDRDITVRELLEELSPNLRKYIEKYLKNTIIFVNGKSIFNLNELDTIIEDGDNISIMPVVGGG